MGCAEIEFKFKLVIYLVKNSYVSLYYTFLYRVQIFYKYKNIRVFVNIGTDKYL